MLTPKLKRLQEIREEQYKLRQEEEHLMHETDELMRVLPIEGNVVSGIVASADCYDQFMKYVNDATVVVSAIKRDEPVEGWQDENEIKPEWMERVK